MATLSPQQVTQLLLAWNAGDSAAQEKLIPLVYGELRQLTKRYLVRERPDHTLQGTALVNKAYMRLVDGKQVHWQNRAHFFAVSPADAAHFGGHGPLSPLLEARRRSPAGITRGRSARLTTERR